MTRCKNHPPRLGEDEIFLIFDVIDKRGDIEEAREGIHKRLHLPRPHRTTVAAVFNVGTGFFRRGPSGKVLTTQEVEEIAVSAGYGVPNSRVVYLHRLYQLWKIHRREETEGESKAGELAEQEKENSTKTTVLDGAGTHQLIEKWRIEVASCSPTQLLQRRLEEASQEALSRFFTDKDTKMLYLEARRPHLKTGDPKRLYLQVECGPIFGLLRQKFPTSTVWTAFEAWGEQAIPYLRAFYDMLDAPESAAHSALDEEGIDDSNLSGFITRCRMERLYAVLLTCDLLARGLAELPSNAHLAFFGGDLEELRLRVNLELSSLTKNTPKGGWSSGIKDICAYSWDLFDPLEETRPFLNELVKLQSIQDSIAIALQELESKI